MAPSPLALRVAGAVLDAAHALEILVNGVAVRVIPERQASPPWPTLSGGRPLPELDPSLDGPWPAPVRLACSWSTGSVVLEARVGIWRQRGRYEGQIALQVVTVPRNREVLWTNLTQRLADAVGQPRCEIPVTLTLYTREGERDARPLTLALSRAAREAGFSTSPGLGVNQVLLFEIQLPSGALLSARDALRALVHASLLKLPYVTRGESGDVVGAPPFAIADLPARQAAAAAVPAAVDSGPGAPGGGEVPAESVSTQENVFFNAVGFSSFGAFDSFEWLDMPRINLVVGANDTGKSHLLKLMYAHARSVEEYTARTASADRPAWVEVLAEKLLWTFQPHDGRLGRLVRRGAPGTSFYAVLCNEEYAFSIPSEARRTASDFTDGTSEVRPQPGLRSVFLPPKEVLTALDGIAAVREQLHSFGFDDTYYDLIRALRHPPVQGALPQRFQDVLDQLEALFGGRLETEEGRFVFARGAERYGMWQAAEGIKKIGILTRLIQNGSLRPNSILFLDEPETNLHPYAARKLVHMLYDLSRAGVQIFAATHSYFVLKQLELIARRHRERVSLCMLRREAEHVSASFSDLQHGAPETELLKESLALYDEDLALTMEG